MPVLYFDEQKNGDVIKNLHWYQQLIEEVHKKAGVSLGSVHISVNEGALLISKTFASDWNTNAASRFDNLGPITFEFLHLQMKVEDFLYKTLITDRSSGQIGTIFNCKVKLGRSNVLPNSFHTFDDNRDFAISFVDAYIVEGLMHFLDMTEVDSTLQAYTFNLNDTEAEKQKWLEHVIGPFIDNYILKEPVGLFLHRHSKY